MTRLPDRRRALLALWALFALISLAFYFRQVWRIFELGPLAWARDNLSLALFASPFWQLAQGNGLPALQVDIAAAGLRLGAALLGAGIVLLAAQGVGEGVLRLLHARLSALSDRLLFRTLFGLGTIAYVSLFLAVLSIYTPAVVRLCLLAASAGSLLWAVRGGRMREGWRSMRAGLRQIRIPWYWQALILAAVGMALVGALAPESEYDALWYHLWLPKIWLQHGHPVDVVNEYISLYPLTWELVYGAAMTFGGPVAAKLLHFACLPLTGLVVYRICRRFFPGAPAWVAVGLFATAPTVMWEATTAYNDLALAFPVALSLYALLAYRREPDRKWLLLSALSLGMALAVKHLALLVLVILSLGTLWLLWRRTRSWDKALAGGAGFAALSLLLPLPWYLRSYLASGNPVFPNLYGLFGAFPPDRWSSVTERGLAQFDTHFGTPHTPLNLLVLPWNVTMHPAWFGGDLGVAFWLLLPALLLVSRRRSIAWLVLAFAALYVALWASSLSSLQLRFLVPLAAPLAVLGATGFGRLLAMARQARLSPGMLSAGLAIVLLLNLPPFISLHEGDRAGNLGWMIHVINPLPVGVVFGFESQDHYLRRKIPSYAAWQYINNHLSPQDLVLTFSGGDQLYSNCPRLWSDATAAHGVVWGAKPGEEARVYQDLQVLGVTYILEDEQITASAGDLPVLSEQFTSRWLEEVYTDGRFTLYRLLAQAAGGAQ